MISHHQQNIVSVTDVIRSYLSYTVNIPGQWDRFQLLLLMFWWFHRRSEECMTQLMFNVIIHLTLKYAWIIALENHPMNLHDFNFLTKRRVSSNLNSRMDCEKINLIDPVERNTVTVSFSRWTAIRFRMDTSVFEYNTQYHNVMQVTHAQYQACNVSAPLVTMTTGNDSFPITRNGHFYFLCGVPGHCQSGQKVDIRVLAPSSMAPSPGGAGGSAMSPGGSDMPPGASSMSPGSADMSPGGAPMSPGGAAMSPGGAGMSPGGSADMVPPPMSSDSTPPGPSPRNDVAHPSQGALGLATLAITAFAGFVTLY